DGAQESDVFVHVQPLADWNVTIPYSANSRGGVGWGVVSFETSVIPAKAGVHVSACRGRFSGESRLVGTKDLRSCPWQSAAHDKLRRCFAEFTLSAANGLSMTARVRG